MHDVCAMTCMHSSVANLQRVGAGAFFSYSDARSNECCDTVVILGNGAASPVCRDSLFLALFFACF